MYKSKIDAWGYWHHGAGAQSLFDTGIALFDPLYAAKGGKGGGKPDKPTDPVGDDPQITDLYISSKSGDAENYDIEYNIRIEFYGDLWTDPLKEDFIAAADFLSLLISDDLTDINLFGELVDDIVIAASLISIDGPGGVLGRAGPTYIRTADSLPISAVMEFDIADAATFDSLGLWDDIVLHEMLHSIGFGTVWDYLGLVDNFVDDNGTKKPTDDTLISIFNGTEANAAWAALYPELASDGGPLVETDGGPGTAGGHWDEETFGNELMTGYIDNTNYLSTMTIGALADMGYGIDASYLI